MATLKARKEIRSISHYIWYFLGGGGNQAPRTHDVYLIVEEEESGEGVVCDEAGDEGLYGDLSVLSFASIDFLSACSRYSIET